MEVQVTKIVTTENKYYFGLTAQDIIEALRANGKNVPLDAKIYFVVNKSSDEDKKSDESDKQGNENKKNVVLINEDNPVFVEYSEFTTEEISK